MTTPADDTAVEDAFEAFLAGRPVPAEAAELAVFAEAVRATATQPGRPNAALAELLATGLLTDQSSPSARTATSAGAPPSRGTRTRNRRRFAMIFPALLAKLLSAGAVAQAATGAGIVVVVATGAGATGVLGNDVQDTITGVVGVTDEEPAPEDSTPVIDEPLADDSVDPGLVPTPADVTTVPLEPVDELEVAAKAWVEEGPADYKNFGEWVSSVAGNRDMRAKLEEMNLKFSDVVTKWAHKKGEDPADYVGTPTPTDEVDVEQPVEDDASAGVAESDDRDDDRSGRGNGKGNNGNGNGNGGKGNGRN